MRASNLCFSAVLVGLATTVASPDASACGGTFCDSGPRSMPVDQTGENVIFVMDDGFVEAHVQIQYQGDPARFAWIVPMQKVPETTVGSAALFTSTLGATVPSYGFTTSRNQCATQRTSFSAGKNAASDAASGTEGPHVSVAYQKTVGAFDVTVLSGESANEVVSWLSMNGYQTIDTAPDILQRYIDKSFVFAAVKLTAGAGTNEIHPLVFKYPGSEPCVPLELTAVAAVDDMNVRTFFFGSERVVPENYRHVILNPVRIDWLQLGANYPDVVARAVDAKGADGQAFVTEYAGTSSVVQTQGLVDPRWDASRFSTLSPSQAISELSSQGLVSCVASSSCSFLHPMISAILQEFLPPQAGMDPASYYSCAQCLSTGDVSKWDAGKFARAVDERIILPASHAVSIVRDHPYLTRLFTRISANEMTLDPVFAAHAGLPDVALPGTATNRVLCNQNAIMQLPTGEQVATGSAGVWPKFDNMPDAARIEDFSVSAGSSKPALIADNGSQINSSLSASNETFGFGDNGCVCSLEKRSAPARVPALLAVGLAALLVRRRRSGAGAARFRRS